MIELKDLLTENVNTSDLKYQIKMSLDDSGIGAKALIGMKPKGADYFLKMKSYMYQDSMNKVLKHVNSVLKSKLKVKNFKKTRMGTEFVLGESINEAYPWYKLDLTPKEESFFDEMEYKIERMHPKKDKQINDFIVSVIDVYSQPQNDMSDVMSKYGMDDILKHVQRKGLKPLKRAV